MIVNCVAHEKGRRSCDLELSELRDWLNNHSGFVWVAPRDPDNQELAGAKAAVQLPDEAIEEARLQARRPINAEYDDILFAVLKSVEYTGRISKAPLSRAMRWYSSASSRPADD